MSDSYPFLRSSKQGVLIDIHLQPGARHEGIKGIHGERLKLAVNSPPVDGKANKRARTFLSSFFHIPKSDVELISGGSSRQKSFLLKGMKRDDVVSAVSAALGS